MQIKILFDKNTLDKNLYTGWGISFLIDNKILFDTGEKGDWLIDNMNKLNLKVDDIDAVVISHDHYDHTGGLWEILENKHLKVYGCPNFSKEFTKEIENLKSEFIAVDKFVEISNGVYLTGEILGLYAYRSIAEQSIFIKTTNGISVLTGCSHPGIIKILEMIKSVFPNDKFYLVAGGFHLMNQDKRLTKIIVDKFKSMQVSKVGPTHCTGEDVEKIFKEEYKNDFISIKVGQVLEV